MTRRLMNVSTTAGKVAAQFDLEDNTDDKDTEDKTQAGLSDDSLY